MILCIHLPRIAIAAERARCPDIAGQPLALLDADERICTLSEEAEAHGVLAGMRPAAARALCPAILARPYSAEACRPLARVAWDALAVESSVVEPASPELCFALLDGRARPERAAALHAAIAAALPGPVSAGLGASRLTAREAAFRAGGGLLVVHPEREPRFLAPAPIDFLEPRLRARLVKLGVRTLGDLQALPQHTLQRVFGEQALRLSRLAQGWDGEPVRAAWPPPALEQTVSFEYEEASSQAVERAIQRCARRIAARLAARREYCRTVSLRLALENRAVAERAERLPEPADSTAALLAAALRLFERMRAEVSAPPLSLTLRAGETGIGGGLQLELLDPWGEAAPHERRGQLETCVAALQARFAAAGPRRPPPGSGVRRIGFFARPIGQRLRERVSVTASGGGAPTGFRRRSRAYTVARVTQSWCETEWTPSGTVEREVWRVETVPPGLFELERAGDAWRLTGIAD